MFFFSEKYIKHCLVFFRDNYLFQCGCVKCLSEADQPDVTSEEEEEDME